MMQPVWLITLDNDEVARWIDDNCVATSYVIGQRAIIVTVNDETDWLMFKLRWCY